MKKSVCKNLLMSIMILIALLLTACTGRIPGGEEPRDTAAIARLVQTGTQGVEINILPNYPPATIYDQNELIAIVEVKNRGNDDLELQDCFVQVTGFDQNIIGGDFIVPRSCAEGVGTLEGKSLYNVEGGFNQIEFRSSNVDLPEGVFDYRPNLNFINCYNYHTKASPSVCVDPLFYQIAAEQKACDYRKNVATGSGQGAPVGVSYVGVDMVGSKAIFEINVVNLGGGRVLSPEADLRRCGESSLEYTDLDKVAYSVDLSGGSLIDCRPRDGFVRLVNNNGKMICSFNIAGASAFETPLIIDLDYGYINSVQRQVNIIQTPE